MHKTQGISGLLSDSHGFLIVRAEEVVRAVLLHSLTPVLSHIEHWTGKTRVIRNKRLPHQRENQPIAIWIRKFLWEQCGIPRPGLSPPKSLSGKQAQTKDSTHHVCCTNLLSSRNQSPAQASQCHQPEISSEDCQSSKKSYNVGIMQNKLQCRSVVKSDCLAWIKCRAGSQHQKS